MTRFVLLNSMLVGMLAGSLLLFVLSIGATMPNAEWDVVAYSALVEDNYEIYLTDVIHAITLNLTQHSGVDRSPHWSPVEPHLTFESDRAYVRHSNGPTNQIFMLNPYTGQQTALITHDHGFSGEATWSPDGQQIAMRISNNGAQIAIIDSQPGARDYSLGVDSANTITRLRWSPDGQQIIYVSRADIWIMRSDGTNIVNLTDDNAISTAPAWSPDGRKIAYWSNDGDDAGIYIVNMDGDRPQLVTTYGEAPFWAPVWSSDGESLVFFVADEQMFYRINRDGSGLQPLVTMPHVIEAPEWMPHYTR